MFAFFPLRLLVALTFALTATSTSLSNVLRPFDEENDLSQIIRLSNGSTPTPHPETVGQLFPNTINEHPFLNIFRRQDPACWTDTAGNTNYCSTNNRCCGDPSNINNGWCCGMDAACGGYSGTDYCTYFTDVVTSTITVTESSALDSTEYITSTASAVVTTITTTSLVVVTESNVETQTDVIWVTAAARLMVRSMVPATVAPKATSLPQTTLSTMQGQWEKLQRPIAMTTAREVLHQRNLNRRQVSTWTSTAYVTETAVETYDDVLTSTIYVTPTRSYTTTIIYTFTSAPNARTTVSVTSTVSAGGQEITPATGGDTSPTPAPSSESLSTGARAGIGAGAGAAGLILIAILALFWRRRQKKNKAETQMMISNAIAAATGTAPGGTQSPLPDKQPQLLGGYVPPPPAQHDRFSDPIPVYHSGHGSPVMLSGHSSPAPIYQPEPHRDAYSPSQDPSPNHELSGTPAVTPPMVRYEYPRPPSPMQAAQGGYGVPQEMSGVRSPGMMYRDTGPYSN